METKKSIRNLFWKASNSDTSSAMDLIEKTSKNLMSSLLIWIL
ncbi:hypothetical protein LEP1GSC037_0682 [Leptospira interrogans str. 2006001854]|uniref:Uncharacterized protein n=1 Tax=Leptospira interrogans str. 2006001854 TaxID=1001590 RepID=M6GT19_LEPIR|nr:hypothetical protein LEP1GSC037_0682 [Leptospira interrogans str. 2006001854]